MQNPKLQQPWMIIPLIKQFSSEQQPIIESVLKIFSGNKQGWELLSKCGLITRKRVEKAVTKFSQFINLIDWDLLSSVAGKAKERDDIYQFTKMHMIADLDILLSVMFKQKEGFQEDSTPFQELLQIISALLKQDFESILIHLERLSKFMDINDSAYKLVEAILVFINSKLVKSMSKESQQKKIISAAESLADWLTEQVKGLPRGTEGYQSLLSLGIQGLILAAYNKNGAFGKLMNNLKGFSNNIIQRLNKIRQYKKYIVEAGRDINFFKPAWFKQLILAISNLYDYATIAYAHFNDDFRTALKNAKKGEGDIIPLTDYIEATKSLSLEKIVMKEGIFSEDWDPTKLTPANECEFSIADSNQDLQTIIQSCSTAPGLQLFIYL